jgi:hypothetical protein
MHRSKSPALLAVLLSGALATSACARTPVVYVAPAPNPEQAALALEDKTSLREPVRIVFGWQLNEAGIRHAWTCF